MLVFGIRIGFLNLLVLGKVVGIMCLLGMGFSIVIIIVFLLLLVIGCS